MKFNVITINTTASIPLFRYILNFFINDLNAEVELTEVNVKEYNNGYKNLIYNKILEFDSYQEFMQQSINDKVTKYLVILKKIVQIYKTKGTQLIYTNDYQVIFCLLLVQSLYRTNSTKIIYHQFELMELKRMNFFNKFIYKYLLKRINRLDLVIFPEQNRLNYFMQQSNLSEEKTFLLPNSCESLKQNEAIPKHKLFDKFPKESFIVAHIGHIGDENFYLTNYLSAIDKMKHHANIHFLFLGRQSQKFKNIIAEKQLDNVVTIDSIPHAELEQIYPFIDLGVILYKATNLNTEFCAPNKLYELWSNGVPVIGHELKGLKGLFEQEEKGILTNFENSQDITDTIIEFSLKKNNRKNLLDTFEHELSISIGLKQLKNKINQLLVN